jgi:hypothetical protein
MKLIYEYTSGQMTYGVEFELTGNAVIERELRYATGEKREGLKPEEKSFKTTAEAEKHLRLRSKTLQQRGYALVEGQAVQQDANESFRDVKEKSPAYQYFEHPQSGQFYDVDLDDSILLLTSGPIGTAGNEGACFLLRWAVPGQ